MLILVLLTFLGIGAATISSIQVRMAANDRNFKRAFYLAESAAMEAVQRIENTAENDLRSGSISWINSQAALSGVDAAGWNGSQSSSSSLDPGTRYGAVDQGVAAGSSLGMGDTNLRSYDVYGRYGGPRGSCLVEVGYRKRF